MCFACDIVQLLTFVEVDMKNYYSGTMKKCIVTCHLWPTYLAIDTADMPEMRNFEQGHRGAVPKKRKISF